MIPGARALILIGPFKRPLHTTTVHLTDNSISHSASWEHVSTYSARVSQAPDLAIRRQQDNFLSNPQFPIVI